MPRPKLRSASVYQHEGHTMSLIRSSFAVSRFWRLLGVLFSALLVLALFHPSVATAQEVKEIKLTEKHIQGFIAISEDMAKLYDGANPDRPDPKREAQAEALVKKNGFASLAEYAQEHQAYSVQGKHCTRAKVL